MKEGAGCLSLCPSTWGERGKNRGVGWGAGRGGEGKAGPKQLRAELDGHIHSNVKYLVAGATEDGSTTLVAFRKVCVSSERVTADAVREAWGAVYLEALRAPEGAEGTAAALNLLEEELQRRLAVCRETVEVVPQGTKQWSRTWASTR